MVKLPSSQWMTVVKLNIIIFISHRFLATDKFVLCHQPTAFHQLLAAPAPPPGIWSGCHIRQSEICTIRSSLWSLMEHPQNNFDGKHQRARQISANRNFNPDEFSNDICLLFFFVANLEEFNTVFVIIKRKPNATQYH